jgi:hypothetical protein
MVLALATLAGAQSLEVLAARYEAVRRAGAIGGVAGRAYAERLRVRDPDRPLTGTTVVLLPRTSAFLARLEEIKRHARDSFDHYRAAPTRVRLAREAYEAALWAAGAPQLVAATVVDADGGFRVDDLPAGEWLLVATHAAFVEVHAAGPSARERTLYRLGPRVVGYWDVTVWLREVEVTRGGLARLELTDRNGWLRGIVEETVPGAGR